MLGASGASWLEPSSGRQGSENQFKRAASDCSEAFGSNCKMDLIAAIRDYSAVTNSVQILSPQPTLLASPFALSHRLCALTFIFVFVMHYHFNVVAALPRSTTAADQARL